MTVDSAPCTHVDFLRIGDCMEYVVTVARRCGRRNVRFGAELATVSGRHRRRDDIGVVLLALIGV